MAHAKFRLPAGEKPQSAETPEVDPRALESFAAGARDRRGPEAPPWEKYDPKEKPKHNVSIRLNDYQLEMLHYLSEAQDMSQNRLLRRQLLPVIEEMAKVEWEKAREQ